MPLTNQLPAMGQGICCSICSICHGCLSRLGVDTVLPDCVTVSFRYIYYCMPPFFLCSCVLLRVLRLVLLLLLDVITAWTPARTKMSTIDTQSSTHSHTRFLPGFQSFVKFNDVGSVLRRGGRVQRDPRININLVGPSEGLIRKRTPLHIAATHGNAGAARTGAQVHSISHPPLSPSGDIGN